jgi:membrane associated rhomboid family serine protease
MIPLGDDRLQNAGRPFITIILILVNVLVFLYEFRLSAADPEMANAFIARYSAIPADIQQGKNILGLFTSMFLHGGWLHLIGNMLFLWIFGDNVEAALGHIGYLFFYLIGGLVGSVSHVLANLGDSTPSLGASGAIAACMGAYIVMFPKSRIRTLIPLIIFFTTIRIPAWVFIGIWIALQVVSSASSADSEGGIAWWAHIGGFFFGAIIGLLFRGRAKKLLVVEDDIIPRRWV